MKYQFTQALEDEAIYIFREVAGQFENPAMLFSGGKDSIVLTHLAMKAFYPAVLHIPLLHVDTGHNFIEALNYRDNLAQNNNLKLYIRYVEDTIKRQMLQEEKGKYASRNKLQTHTLLEAIEELQFDACIGGGRRDEEKARAKERIFSIRDEFGQWDVKNQRPEAFMFLNGRIQKGANVRVFPLSNWTEFDIWSYIERENITLPPLYFSHDREVIVRDGLLWSNSEYIQKFPGDEITMKKVRFRTVGDMTCTAAMESDASTVSDILDELKTSITSERGESRIDDKMSDSAMEERKRAGYF